MPRKTTTQIPPQRPSTDANKVLVRRWFHDVLNQRDLDVAKQICAKDMIFRAWHWPELNGFEGLEQFLAVMQNSCPDFHYSIEEMLAEGDKVFVRWTFTGTHSGEIMGVAPTQKFVTVPGMATFRIVEGKIAEHFGYWDALGMLQWLSAIEVRSIELPAHAATNK